MAKSAELVSKHPLLKFRGDNRVWFIKLVVQDQRGLPKVRDKYFLDVFELKWSKGLTLLIHHACLKVNGTHLDSVTLHSEMRPTKVTFHLLYDS